MNDIRERILREQAAAYAFELKKRNQTDPLFRCDLHPKQAAFVQSCLSGEVKENWFVAANRAGKSQAGAYVGAHFARFGMPGTPNAAIGRPRKGFQPIEVRDRATAGWVSALDFPTSRDVLQPKYFDNGMGLLDPLSPPFIPIEEIQEWRVSDQLLKLKNGSIIGFKSADSGRAKFQGAGRDWVHMDEEHPYEIYEEITMRVGTRPLNFFCTATILPPEGSNARVVSWVFPIILQPFMDGTFTRGRCFGASIYDNPHIPESEIAYLESLHPVGSVTRRIRLEGEWLPGLGGARAYHAFNRTIHVRPQPEMSLRRPLCWFWDFNVEPMCSGIGQKDGNIYRVYKEFTLTPGNIPEMCQMFYDKFPEHHAEIWLYGDSTGNGRNPQTGRSDYFLILQEMKAYGVPIRLNIPEKNPPVPDRVNSVNRVLHDEEGEIRLEIDPSCRELALDLEGVLRDARGGIFKTTNKKDPYFHRTHISDALGYWIAHAEPVRPPQSRHHGVRIPTPSYNVGRR